MFYLCFSYKKNSVYEWKVSNKVPLHQCLFVIRYENMKHIMVLTVSFENEHYCDQGIPWNIPIKMNFPNFNTNYLHLC